MPSRRLRRTRRAFTLVELLVVLLVLGVLLGIALPALLNSQNGAKDASAKSKLSTAYKTLKAYAAQHEGNFPADGAGVVSTVQGSEPNFPISNTKTPAADNVGICSASTDEAVLVALSRSGHSFAMTASKGGSYSLTQASCPLDLPGAAGKPTAEAGDGEATVSWAAPSSGAEPTGYVVTSSPDGKTCATSNLSCTVADLTNGTAYTFTVVTSNGDGDGPPSSPSDPVTPQASGYQPAAGIYFVHVLWGSYTSTIGRVQSDGTGLVGALDSPHYPFPGIGSSAKRVLFFLEPGGQYRVSRPDGTEAVTLSKPEGCEWGADWPELSYDGEEVYFSCDYDENRRVFTFNANTGVTTETGTLPEGYQDMPLSPDGTKRIKVDLNIGLQVTDSSGNNATTIVPAPSEPEHYIWSSGAHWSRDGTKIVFASDYQAPDWALICPWPGNCFWSGTAEWYVVNADGSGLTRLPGAIASGGAAIFSPDKSKVVYANEAGGISVTKADGTGSPTEILSSSSVDEVLFPLDWY